GAWRAGSGAAPVIRPQWPGTWPSRRFHRRPGSPGREARRHCDRAADQVRAGDQHEDGQGAQLNYPAIAAVARPRGDQVTSRRTMLGGAPSLGLLVAARHAVGQRPGKLFRIGYLSLRAGPNAWDEAFVQRLRELGYRNGDNLLIEYRWADEDLSLLERQADELVRLPVDVIVTNQAPAVRIAKKATATIPIVMPSTADPVGAGLIPSFARPGGNLTGLSYLTTDLAAKRLQLLRELVPGAARIAVLAWDIVGRESASK